MITVSCQPFYNEPNQKGVSGGLPMREKPPYLPAFPQSQLMPYSPTFHQPQPIFEPVSHSPVYESPKKEGSFIWVWVLLFVFGVGIIYFIWKKEIDEVVERVIEKGNRFLTFKKEEV